MKIDIVIPTRQRPKQLNLLLETIQCALIPNVKVWVFFDAWKELNQFKAEHNWHNKWLNMRILGREFAPPMFLNDFLLLSTADVVINLSDHCTVSEDYLKAVVKAFKKYFPDYDGVVAAKVSDMTKQMESAFCAVGMKFADRFPNRAIWCPDYKVFYCDEELGLFAKSIDKFYFCEAAQLTYYFPHTTLRMDSTWKWHRRNKREDVEMNRKRHKANLLWGRDFGLLTR